MTITHLTDDTNSSSASSYNTASISPGSNDLIIVTVVSRTGTSTNPNQPTLSGNGLTYEVIDGDVFDNTSSSRRRETKFRAMGVSPSSGAISISFGGQTQTTCTWSIEKVSGDVDTSGANGSGAIKQSAINSDRNSWTADSPKTLTVTLPSAPDSNNIVLATFGFGDDSQTQSGDAAYTELSNISSGVDGASVGILAQYAQTTNQTVEATASFETEICGIAIEIQAAATTPKGIPLKGVS